MNSVPETSEHVFDSARLSCRRWRAADLPALLAVYGDPEAMRWVGDGDTLTAEDCANWLQVTEENYRQRGYGMFALEARDSGKVIGFCGLIHPGGQVEPEVKYAFLREHWGKGLASEVLRPLLTWGHEQCGLKRIIATIAPENAASCRVLIKAGMDFVEIRTEEDGCFSDVYEWIAPSVNDAD